MNRLIGKSSREVQQMKRNLLKEKILLYRRKPDLMNEEMLGIKQNLYQRVAIRALMQKKYNIWVWSRGLGKSWTAALAAVDFALLYPGMRIGIAAPSFRQSKMIVENKIAGELARDSLFLQQEIKKNKGQLTKTSVDTVAIEFLNGSKIMAFPVGTDGSKIRGLRLEFVIIDEFAQINPMIVDRVIKPMLVVQAGYKVGKTDYSDVVENRMLFVSSAYFKFNHLYKTVETYGKMITEGSDEHFVSNLDYRVGIDVGLYSEDYIANEKNSQAQINFDMEYGARFIDLSEDNWISPTDLNRCSTMREFEFSADPKYKYIMGIDVARVSGNDNTAIKVAKLVPNQDHYIKENVYSYTMNGATFGEQNMRIREILQRFPVDRIYMDTTGLGVGLADELAKPFYNIDTDTIDPPLCDVNNKEHVQEIKDGNFIIYGQKFSAEFNYRLAVAAKKNVQKARLRMYAPETEGVYKDNLSSDELYQIEEATKTRSEMISIEAKPRGNYMSFEVPSGSVAEGRKDRYTAISLVLYGADEMEYEDFREKEETGFVPMASISRREIY